MKVKVNFNTFYWTSYLGYKYRTQRYQSLESERKRLLEQKDYHGLKQVERDICRHVSHHFEAEAYITKDPVNASLLEKKARELKTNPEMFFTGAA